MPDTASPSHSWRGRRIDALTSLRFFAALGIVLGHFSPTLALPDHAAVRALFLVAGAMVMLFFVLSGFVLTLQYDAELAQRGGPALQRYARARFARVAPMYGLVLLITLLAYWATDFRVSLGGDAHTPAKFATFVVNALALQAWWPSVAMQQFWNAPGWSISAEVFFYALLPWLLRVRGLSGSLSSILAVLVGGWLVACAVASTFWALSLADPGWVLLGSRLPLLNLPAFVLGIVLARRHMARPPGQARPRRWFHSPLAPLLALLATALILVDRDLSFASTALLPQALWVPALFAWLITALACGGPGVMTARPLVLLGDASYTLYLIHWLPLGFLLSGVLVAPVPPWLGAATVVGLVALSVLLYRGIEAPARRWLLQRG